MDKINCIVFGLSGHDTAPIVRMMKNREEFSKVIWFGILNDVDINSFKAYEFQKDYDLSISLPPGYYDHMKEKLGQFLISSARRNVVRISGHAYVLPFGPTYDYLHHFTRYCYYIYDLLLKNRINLIVIDGFPHTSIDILLCQAASFFGIKILLLYQTNISNKFMYFSQLEDNSGNFAIYYDDNLRPVKNKERDYKIEYPKPLFYMRDFSDFFYTHDKLQYDLAPLISKVLPKFSLVTLILYCLKLCNNYKKLIQTKTLASIFLKHISYLIYEDNLKKISIKNPDLLKKYVYFPLSHQPELTTECMGKEYLDIISAIEKLDAFLPNDWLIYVKDHVIQYEFARDQTFFDRLSSIRRVRMIDRSFSSFSLIENSQFVSSVNGTAGMEALQMGKKVLNFGTVYYEKLPGVIVYNENCSFENFNKMTYTKDELETALNILISRMETGVVNESYSAMVSNFDPHNNAKAVSDFICRFYAENIF